MTKEYQLIVIGAGPGGYVAAIKAAQLGKRVAVVESREVGGTCLNRGCIPTKVFAHAAEVLQELKNSDKLGLRVEGVSYDAAAMYARKDEVVEQLRTGVEKLLKANKIDLIAGQAKLCGVGTVKVDDQEYAAEHILIATGSKPARPLIAGIDLPGVVTSDELLTGDSQIYQKIVIIGGGVIGMEFAAIYQALGAEVTVIEAMDRILPTMDKEIAQNLAMILKKRGVKIYTGARVEKIERQEGLLCHFTAKGQTQTVTSDGVLVSVGRIANTEGLLGSKIELNLDRGRIPVNERFETCVKGIYAVGDVIKDGIQLAHIASAQGVNAVYAMYGQELPIDFSAVPSCIYTVPEIASVGISSDQAKAEGIPVKTGKFVMSANGKTVIAMAERGFVKVVFHAESNVILGAQMMCCRATDMIGELCMAISNRLTIDQLSTVIRPHPTFSEGIGEAVEDTENRAIHAMPRK